jgi:hypothetical protein
VTRWEGGRRELVELIIAEEVLGEAGLIYQRGIWEDRIQFNVHGSMKALKCGALDGYQRKSRSTRQERMNGRASLTDYIYLFMVTSMTLYGRGFHIVNRASLLRCFFASLIL